MDSRNKNPDAGSESLGKIDTKSGGREGAKILVGYPRDNSSMAVRNSKGGKMGGSLTNLAHSLPGTSANQKGPR